MKKLFLIFSLIILGVGIGYFFYQQGYQKGHSTGFVDGLAENVAEDMDNSKKLEDCLTEAGQEYDDTFRLNSKPKLGESTVGTWNSEAIKLQTEEQYNKDREFCLKLYKN